MRYRILNAESLNYFEKAKALLKTIADVDYFASLDENDIKRRIGGYDGLIVRLKTNIGKEIMQKGKKLLFIASATTGLDHIDLKSAKRRGIKVISLSGEKKFLRNIYATAEYAFGLILAVTRNIPAAFSGVKNKQWDRYKFIGTELHGKTLGIVGYGRVGKMVSGYAKSFGMKVIACEKGETVLEKHVERAGLNELLRKSDIVSIHLPLNNETFGIFNKSAFKKMKRSSCLINTSRGEVLDEKALLWALKNRRIKGAALDVVSGERNNTKERSVLEKYAGKVNNLIITPHIAGATFESMEKTEVFIAGQIASFLRKKRP